MKILIRADSTLDLGTGHVMRCLTLADELRRGGAEVRFASRACPGNLVSLVRQRGFGVHVLPDVAAQDDLERQDALNTRAVADSFAPDWLVVDNYALGFAWEASLRQAVPSLLAIDDLNRTHDCGLLLDQNWFGIATEERYRDNRAPDCRRLLGPRYSLLRPEYAVLRAVLPSRQGDVGRVLVFFGGGDPNDETTKVLEALASPELASLMVDVVVGVNHPDPAGIEAQVRYRKGTVLHRNLPTLAGLMARADLALGAGGATTWERVALGLPSVVAVVADNQAAPSLALHAHGAQLVLGDLATKPDAAAWRMAVGSLLSDPERLRAMSAAAMQLTDGLGAKRVARAMLAASNLGLQLRPAELGDEALLLEWANDPVVRGNSFSKQPIPAAEHGLWLRKRLAEPTTLILIGEDRLGLPIGQVRLDANPERGEAIIDISVDASLRGLGLGAELLRRAVTEWDRRGTTSQMVAEVAENNSASAQTFLRCGFTECEQRRAGARCFARRVRGEVAQ